MSARVQVFLALAVAIGFLLGWLARGPGEPDDIMEPTGSGDRVSPPREAERTRSNQLRDRASRDDDEAGNDDAEDVLQVAPDAVAALLSAKVAGLEERSQLVQTGEPLEQLINMTEEEATTLNDFWDRTKPGLDEIRLENVKHQRLDDGGVWLGVEPFAEQGEALRVDFHVTVLEVLGESRGRVFLDAIGAHNAFGKWGKTVGSGFTIHMVVQEDESLLYEIQEQAAADGAPGRRWNTSRVPAHLAEMADAAGIRLSL